MKPRMLSSIDMVMNFDSNLKPRTEDPMKRAHGLHALSPFETGLTTALHRAFAPVHERGMACEFEDLLARLR